MRIYVSLLNSVISKITVFFIIRKSFEVEAQLQVKFSTNKQKTQNIVGRDITEENG